ncbi:hypothetical protein ACFCXF_27675 [Streptomyces virginiae]|uniref:hypothetical protein n=1 Tax=Streptomyces virginiae TaxID=1961 RepID=UPI0035D80554
MAKSVRLGIIRARHDLSVPTIPDAACISMLMSGAYSVPSYWEATTRNYLNFVDSIMFPWVDMTLGADTSRLAQADAAIAAMFWAHFPLDPLAGISPLIILIHPGSPGFDAGHISINGRDMVVAPVSGSDHTFMCHELGHALGVHHSFGLDNNGTDYVPGDADIVVGPEYGSPYDLMSSATFAERYLGSGPFYYGDPTFIGPTIADWPYPGAFSMGPHLSRANLHLCWPVALAGRVVEDAFPQQGAVTARIVPASASNGRCLLLLHPPGEQADGVGRVYVEYRTAMGWDAGMAQLGPNLSRGGVVVHTVASTPKGPRVWYRGSIPSSSVDYDLAVTTTPLVVRVVGVDPDRNWVDLSVTMGAVQGVEIVQSNYFDDIVGTVGELQQMQTPCGESIRRGTFSTSTSSQFGVRTSGFGGGGEPGAAQPTVEWSIGGMPITAQSGIIHVPVGGVTFTVTYSVDPVVFDLTVTSHGGDRFETPVMVKVTDGAGAMMSATAVFTASGWFESIHPDDMHVLGACIAEIADRYRRLPGPFRMPTPEPTWGLAERRLAEQAWLEQAIRAIVQPPALDSAGYSALSQLLQLQVQPTAILDALRAGGVDFSVPETDLTDRLKYPEFTPYPALAQSLLLLLDGRHLRRPVALDVIVSNYEQAAVNPLPRHVDGVSTDLLKAAVVEGSNMRYGERVAEFGRLLV